MIYKVLIDIYVYPLQTFVTATQVTATAVASNTVTTTGTTIGSCLTDSFSITSPGLGGSPLICGTNTGYHSKFCISLYRVL